MSKRKTHSLIFLLIVLSSSLFNLPSITLDIYGSGIASDGFVAFLDTTTSTSTPKERSWVGSSASWTDLAEMDTAGSAVRWVRTAYTTDDASDKRAIKIVVTLSDDYYLDAYVWQDGEWTVSNNIGFTDTDALATKLNTYRCFDIVFVKYFYFQLQY